MKIVVSDQTFECDDDVVENSHSYFRVWKATRPVIKRDPTHFRHILNHMRGSTALPDARDVLCELRFEADFYGLQDMVAQIDAKLARKTDDLFSALREVASAIRDR